MSPPHAEGWKARSISAAVRTEAPLLSVCICICVYALCCEDQWLRRLVSRLTGPLRVGVSAALSIALAGACAPAAEPPARPSVLLVVLDTTRLDAVSAYGHVEATTPYLDRLAREGLLYRWAVAPSPWTLPSHATLFTSLGPDRHGVGLNGRMALADVRETLAGRLRAEGYETAGFSENPLIAEGMGLVDGFELFFGESHANWLRWSRKVPRFDAARAVAVWSERRDGPSRPFFLFVNLFDPHDPYELQEGTRLPAGVTPEEAAPLGRGGRHEAISEFAGICDRLPPPRELGILRSLYLGEVSAADAKLRRIHRAAREAAGGRLLTVVTADHGEHLGEHRLLGHEFSLHAEVLRVPLVVHGLEGTDPAEIEAPVGLRDLAPAIAAWVGAEPAPGWQGRPLPTRPGTEADAPRTLSAFYDDAPLQAPRGYRHDAEEKDRRRLGCDDADGVFGDIRAVLHFPYKRIDYTRRDPQLYDLRWDPFERSDLWPQRGEEEILAEELGAWKAALRVAAGREPAEAVDAELLESLRALGYAE